MEAFGGCQGEDLVPRLGFFPSPILVGTWPDWRSETSGEQEGGGASPHIPAQPAEHGVNGSLIGVISRRLREEGGGGCSSLMSQEEEEGVFLLGPPVVVRQQVHLQALAVACSRGNTHQKDTGKSQPVSQPLVQLLHPGRLPRFLPISQRPPKSSKPSLSLFIPPSLFSLSLS